MPQQLPQIAILRIRYPDPREAIFQQEPQQQLRVLAIGLLLAHLLRAHSRGIADPQLNPQLDEHSIMDFLSIRIKVQSVIALAEHMRRGCPVSQPSPKKSPPLRIPIVASFPLVATTVSFTFPRCM